MLEHLTAFVTAAAAGPPPPGPGEPIPGPAAGAFALTGIGADLPGPVTLSWGPDHPGACSVAWVDPGEAGGERAATLPAAAAVALFLSKCGLA
jgi:hypothetical protein